MSELTVPHELKSAMTELGVWSLFAQLAEAATDWGSLKAADAEVRQLAERNYKDLALKAHPDVGGDVEAMTRLNLAIATLRGFTLAQPPPIPQFTVVHVWMDWGTGTGWGTGTTSVTGDF